MSETYIERRYCDDCVTVHWLEVTPLNREVCHGENLTPTNTPTHYVKRSGRGYKLIEKTKNNQSLTEPEPLPLPFQDW